MAKLYLPRAPPENAQKSPRVYVEFELCDTEKKLEDLFEGMGLEFKQRELNFRGTDTGGEYPNNLGYEIGIVDDKTYKGMGAWYGRWIYAAEEISLEKALYRFNTDEKTYQYLTFYFDGDYSKAIRFIESDLGGVYSGINKGIPIFDEVRRELLRTNKNYQSLISDHGNLEENKFENHIADLARTVVGTLK
jgi:hypothetical protein